MCLERQNRLGLGLEVTEISFLLARVERVSLGESNDTTMVAVALPWGL